MQFIDSNIFHALCMESIMFYQGRGLSIWEEEVGNQVVTAPDKRFLFSFMMERSMFSFAHVWKGYLPLHQALVCLFPCQFDLLWPCADEISVSISVCKERKKQVIMKRTPAQHARVWAKHYLPHRRVTHRYRTYEDCNATQVYPGLRSVSPRQNCIFLDWRWAKSPHLLLLCYSELSLFSAENE